MNQGSAGIYVGKFIIGSPLTLRMNITSSGEDSPTGAFATSYILQDNSLVFAWVNETGNYALRYDPVKNWVSASRIGKIQGVLTRASFTGPQMRSTVVVSIEDDSWYAYRLYYNLEAILSSTARVTRDGWVSKGWRFYSASTNLFYVAWFKDANSRRLISYAAFNMVTGEQAFLYNDPNSYLIPDITVFPQADQRQNKAFILTGKPSSTYKIAWMFDFGSRLPLNTTRNEFIDTGLSTSFCTIQSEFYDDRSGYYFVLTNPPRLYAWNIFSKSRVYTNRNLPDVPLEGFRIVSTP